MNNKNYGKPVDLVPPMKEMIARGESFWLIVTGSSMYPTLKHERDRVYISPFNGIPKIGDILLTELRGSHCMLHRVIKRDNDMVYYNGDRLSRCEGPLPVSDVIGIVTQLERNGKIIKTDHPFYQIWCAFWQKTIRFRQFGFRVLNKIRRTIRLN